MKRQAAHGTVVVNRDAGRSDCGDPWGTALEKGEETISNVGGAHV